MQLSKMKTEQIDCCFLIWLQDSTLMARSSFVSHYEIAKTSLESDGSSCSSTLDVLKEVHGAEEGKMLASQVH